MEQSLYHEGIRSQSLAGFFRLQDRRFQATGEKAQKIRLTCYLIWGDDHDGSAAVGSTIQYFSTNGSSVALDGMGEARAFYDLAKAADWLTIPVDVLTLKDKPAPAES